MRKVFGGLISGVIICSLLFTACSKQDGKNTPKTIVLNIGNAPKTIDPQLQTSTPATQVDAACMEGLIRQGEKMGELYPAGAEKWDVSDDGKTWTFHLRKNAKWSNGEPLTSADYLFGFKRLLMPEVAAQYAYMIYCIKNAKEYNLGKIKNFSKVGIKAIDDYTLKIQLENPLPYFDEIMTFCATYPLNEKFYNSVKDTYAMDKDSLLYNGPYMITKWVPNGEYAMTKNPHYWNKENIKIENISLQMIENYNTAANMFKSGELDITPISGDQIAMFKGSKDLHRIADSVWFFKFNITNKYFKNAKIRKAVSMAINREVYCEDIRKDGSLPAYAFVPPGINGGKVDGKKITFRERCGDSYFKYDPEQAKKLFEEGLKELGLKRPVNVKLLTDNNDVSRRDGQFLQEELKKNLDMDVILDPNTFQSRLTKTELLDYDFCTYGWLPDYNDPNTFMNMWVTKGGNNNTGYSSIKYDSLINIAETSPDKEKRMKAMQKAEKMLMDDMIIAPLYYRSTNYLIKPYIKDFVLRGLGVKASFVWAYVENKK